MHFICIQPRQPPCGHLDFRLQPLPKELRERGRNTSSTPHQAERLPGGRGKPRKHFIELHLYTEGEYDLCSKMLLGTFNKQAFRLLSNREMPFVVTYTFISSQLVPPNEELPHLVTRCNIKRLIWLSYEMSKLKHEAWVDSGNHARFCPLPISCCPRGEWESLHKGERKKANREDHEIP